MIMHSAIKLRHIRAFLDIAGKGSLTAAAHAQGITQPALSRSLAELEALLGGKLFHRQGRRLVLTEQGALFRRHAASGLSELEAGAAALKPGGAGAPVRVGVLPTASTRLFPRIALRFAELSPATPLSIATGPHPYLMQLLREGAIDLMLGRMPAPGEMAGLSFLHLSEEAVVLAARAGHPLSDRPATEVLTGAPVILPPADAIIRRPVDLYLASLGIAGLRPAFETVALAVGRGIVLGSDAVWFISEGVVAEELDSGQLVALPTGARFLSGAVGITRREARAPDPGLELLVEIAREVAARPGRGAAPQYGSPT